MMSRLFFVTACLVLTFDFKESAAIEDLYEGGGATLRFNAPSDESTEVYRAWIEGTDFWEHHFSPGYAASDPDPFWDRADKQAPTPFGILHSLWREPKHLVWDTPKNMGLNLKADYYDTLKESENGWEIAQDMLTGLPNTAMILLNGGYDSFTNGYTDIWSPVVYGGLFLWPTRIVSNLTKPVPEVYNVVDVIPKVLWSVGLPVRKVAITVADQVQMGANFVYRSVTGPLRIPDHFNRYWGPRRAINYSPRTYVPKNPQTTPSGTRKIGRGMPIPSSRNSGSRKRPATEQDRYTTTHPLHD